MNPKDVRTVADLEKHFPDHVLVDIDYDVLHTLISCGFLPDELENDPDWIESDDWLDCEYNSCLFIQLDESGTDYHAVWSLSWGSIPWLDRPVELIWLDHTKLVPAQTPEFDRFDICEAYHVLEINYNISGVLQERKSNQRRKMSTGFQLHRMKFTPRPSLDGYYDNLTPNGRAIYDCWVIEHKLG